MTDVSVVGREGEAWFKAGDLDIHGSAEQFIPREGGVDDGVVISEELDGTRHGLGARAGLLTDGAEVVDLVHAGFHSPASRSCRRGTWPVTVMPRRWASAVMAWRTSGWMRL